MTDEHYDGDTAKLYALTGRAIDDIDADPAHAAWREELEALWSTVEAVSTHFFGHGCIDHGAIAALVEEHAR